ncbi:MAG: UPF0001 protein YggS, partial [uncultured Gemmatimonadaceae bacterium]
VFSGPRRARGRGAGARVRGGRARGTPPERRDRCGHENPPPRGGAGRVGRRPPRRGREPRAGGDREDGAGRRAGALAPHRPPAAQQGQVAGPRHARALARQPAARRRAQRVRRGAGPRGRRARPGEHVGRGVQGRALAGRAGAGGRAARRARRGARPRRDDHGAVRRRRAGPARDVRRRARGAGGAARRGAPRRRAVDGDVERLPGRRGGGRHPRPARHRFVRSTV